MPTAREETHDHKHRTSELLLGAGRRSPGCPAAARPCRRQRCRAATTAPRLNILSRSSPSFDATIEAGRRVHRGHRHQAAVDAGRAGRPVPEDDPRSDQRRQCLRRDAVRLPVEVRDRALPRGPLDARQGRSRRAAAGSRRLSAQAAGDLRPRRRQADRPADGRRCLLHAVEQGRYTGRRARPREARPSSWDEIVERGRKLTGTASSAIALPAGKTIAMRGDSGPCSIHAFGGNYFDAGGASRLGGEAGVKTMRFMAEELEAISASGQSHLGLQRDAGQLPDRAVRAGRDVAGRLRDPGRSRRSRPWSASSAGAAAGRLPARRHLDRRQCQVDASRGRAALRAVDLARTEIVRAHRDERHAPARLSALRRSRRWWPNIRTSRTCKTAMLGDTFGYIPMKEAEQIHMMIARRGERRLRARPRRPNRPPPTCRRR